MSGWTVSPGNVLGVGEDGVFDGVRSVDEIDGGRVVLFPRQVGLQRPVRRGRLEEDADPGARPPSQMESPL